MNCTETEGGENHWQLSNLEVKSNLSRIKRHGSKHERQATKTKKKTHLSNWSRGTSNGFLKRPMSFMIPVLTEEVAATSGPTIPRVGGNRTGVAYGGGAWGGDGPEGKSISHPIFRVVTCSPCPIPRGCNEKLPVVLNPGGASVLGPSCGRILPEWCTPLLIPINCCSVCTQ